MTLEGSAVEPPTLVWILPLSAFVRLSPLKLPDGRIDSEFHMDIQIRMRSVSRRRRCLLLSVAAACVLLPWMAAAQALTVALVGTVKDEQGAVLPGSLI